MFIQIHLLNGYREPLWYTVPEHLQPTIVIGAIVTVPIRTQIVLGMVHIITTTPPLLAYTVRAIIHVDQHMTHPRYRAFLNELCALYHLYPLMLIKRLTQFLKEKQEIINPEITINHTTNFNTIPLSALTSEQQAICDTLLPAITNGIYTPALLHGVTGSGKTEIYKKLMLHTLSHNKSVLFLFPEVTLAQTFQVRLRAECGPEIPLMGFHSGSTLKERKLVWQELYKGNPIVVLGVHLPIMLPFTNLGLIIVDEEHEVGYQEKKHPKINSKDAALIRAHHESIPIVLGSATPSLTSLYKAKTESWLFFQLKKRFAGTFPEVQLVLMKTAPRRGNFWISEQLYKALERCLLQKEQAIIFINRRGYSFFIQCKECNYIALCHACSVSLTLHEDHLLTCHYCGYHTTMTPHCPACKKGELLKKGLGTQQVVTILKKLFPLARIDRLDHDITKKKNEWQKVVTSFAQGNTDILVGTQSVIKGYDFKGVTLVGVLWADLSIHFPLYNAAEVSLQQLIQVAGRAGRHTKNSIVIVQAMHDHPIFTYLNEQSYLSFYRHEIQARIRSCYPPAYALAQIEVRSLNEKELEKESFDLLKALNAYTPSSVTILGPAKPPVHMINKMHIRTLYLKAPHISDILLLYHTAINHTKYKSMLAFIPNPVQ